MNKYHGRTHQKLPLADNTAYQREKFFSAMDALLFPGKFSNVLCLAINNLVLA